jgi:hypothetical protein
MNFTKKITNNITLLFIFGIIAWFFSMLPSIYIEKRKNIKVDWSNMILTLPLFYGFMNIIILLSVSKLFDKYEMNNFNNYFIAGVIMSFFYSGIGRFSGHAQKYGLNSNYELHFYAIILYTFVYGILFNYIDENIC